MIDCSRYSGLLPAPRPYPLDPANRTGPFAGRIGAAFLLQKQGEGRYV